MDREREGLEADAQAPGGERLRLTRRSIPSEIADSLRQRILTGELAEGVPLRQETLAESYGVSRIPVREALKHLEAEGLVTIEPHRGARVSGLALDEIGELYELRACLEGDLATRAVPRLTAEHLAAMEAALAAYEAALEREQIGDWGTLNWRFHKALLQAAQRPLWLEELRGLNERTERYVRMQLALTGALRQAQTDHRTLLALARSGDAEEVGRVMRSHIEAAGRALVRRLQQQR